MIATAITISVKDGFIVDWIDLDLPYPHSAEYKDQYSAEYWNAKTDTTPYELTYSIDGYFGTRKGKQYLHDIGSRIAYALNGTYAITETAIEGKAYNLNRFTHLERVPTFNQNLEANAMGGSRNDIFNALRHKAYQMHRSNTLDLEALTVYGNHITNGSEHIKYLAKNVFQWVDEKYTGRQSTMNRSEAGRNAHTTKADRMETKIFNALRSKLFTVRNFSATAKSLSISRITFKKYLTKYREIQRVTELLSTPYARLVYTPIEKMAKFIKNITIWEYLEEDISLLSHKVDGYLSKIPISP